ncbi:MAG: hypothetical protein SVW02_02990 [Candidatus Nanohaloarchaea archaeon]|nr:hypothetical protein [Candidatus Nanohaloarchaea archaeon]
MKVEESDVEREASPAATALGSLPSPPSQGLEELMAGLREATPELDYTQEGRRVLTREAAVEKYFVQSPDGADALLGFNLQYGGDDGRRLAVTELNTGGRDHGYGEGYTAQCAPSRVAAGINEILGYEEDGGTVGDGSRWKRIWTE